MLSVRAAAPLAAAFGAAIGITAGFWAGGSSDPIAVPIRRAPAADDLRDEIATLRLSLATLREENTRLEEEMESLRLEVEWLRPAAGVTGDEFDVADPDDAAERQTSEDEKAEAAAVAAIPIWFDEEALLERGLAAREAERLRQRFDQKEMQLLFLRDRATREGWAGTPRFRMAARSLRNHTRGDLGDEDFDLMLYAAGRNNRVIVSDLLIGSPARDSGLLRGDVIVGYDGTRIFDALDLRAASSSGRAGATTPVDVVRGGEIIRLYVDRGPLGARLRHGRRPPDTLY